MTNDALLEIKKEVMKECLPNFRKSLGKKYKVKLKDGVYVISSSKPSGGIHTRRS